MQAERKYKLVLSSQSQQRARNNLTQKMKYLFFFKDDLKRGILRVQCDQIGIIMRLIL